MQGPLRGMRWTVGAGRHAFWLGGYEAEKQRLMSKHVGPGDVFYDIGASVGFYTLFASRFVLDGGRVYSFEPVPQNAAFTEKHIHLNQLENVDFFPLALADFDGKARFREGATAGTGRFDPTGNLEIKVARLDTLIASKLLKPATVLKIDVEGAECEVLRGAENLLRVHKPRIFLATHGDEAHEECVRYLAALDYQFLPLTSTDGGGELYVY